MTLLSTGSVALTDQQITAQTIRTRLDTAERIRELLSGEAGYDDPEHALTAYIEGLRSALADAAPEAAVAAAIRNARPRRTRKPPPPPPPPRADTPADA